MRTRSTPADLRDVAIVSANPETLHSLETYLRDVGVQAKGRRTLEDSSDLTSGSTLAIVLFADDFPWETVIATIAERCPSTLGVLVTRHTPRYERLVEGYANVLVVPRPVWSWMIRDAIRLHAHTYAAPSKSRRRGRAPS